MDTYLSEISQFQFPSVGIDDLTREPYLSYIQLYKETYKDLKFYRGFVRPNIVDRAKIYRALNLCCVDNFSMKDIIVFASGEGLIIKCKYADDPIFNSNLDFFISQENYSVFIPEKCDKLDKYNYSYYSRMLNNFIFNERIPGKAFWTSEKDNIFLFLSLDTCDNEYKSDSGPFGNIILERKWREYIEGGVLRKHVISADKLSITLKVFSWVHRFQWEILSDNRIEITVKSSSLKDFESRLEIIENDKQYSTDFKYIDCDFIINDEYEGFGILRILKDNNIDVDKIIPLVGTRRIYYPENISKDILSILNEYKPNILPEGKEIFTQDEFNEMSKWRQASLIDAPSGNFYSFLDLCRDTKTDPLTRETFSENFIDQMNKIRDGVNGIFMLGFPPIRLEPELLIVNSSRQTISFYIKVGNDINAFWIIPNLADTEFSQITIDAITILVIKWSDRSLFKGSFMCNENIPDNDINLIFSPIALYVFEKTISDLTDDSRSLELKCQAQYLQDQISILKICK